MRTDVMIKYILILAFWFIAFVLLWVAAAFGIENLKESITTLAIAVALIAAGCGLEKW